MRLLTYSPLNGTAYSVDQAAPLASTPRKPSTTVFGAAMPVAVTVAATDPRGAIAADPNSAGISAARLTPSIVKSVSRVPTPACSCSVTLNVQPPAD